MPLDDSCTLYGPRRFWLNAPSPMKRTLLTVGVAVLISMLFVPYGGMHHGVIFNSGRGTFWNVPYDLIAVTPLILQTIFAAVAVAVIVNLLPRRPRKWRRLNTPTKSARKDKRGVDLISDVLPFGRVCYAEPNASDFVIKKLPPPTPTVWRAAVPPRTLQRRLVVDARPLRVRRIFPWPFSGDS